MASWRNSQRSACEVSVDARREARAIQASSHGPPAATWRRWSTPRSQEALVIAHIVFFQPKPTVSENDRVAFARQFERVCREIPTVRRAAVGKRTEIDPGYPRSFGDGNYSFAAVLEFDDRDGLIAYLQHPMHKELGRLFWLVCERTSIIEVSLADAKTSDLAEIIGSLGH